MSARKKPSGDGRAQSAVRLLRTLPAALFTLAGAAGCVYFIVFLYRTDALPPGLSRLLRVVCGLMAAGLLLLLRYCLTAEPQDETDGEPE